MHFLLINAFKSIISNCQLCIERRQQVAQVHINVSIETNTNSQNYSVKLKKDLQVDNFNLHFSFFFTKFEKIKPAFLIVN